MEEERKPRRGDYFKPSVVIASIIIVSIGSAAVTLGLLTNFTGVAEGKRGRSDVRPEGGIGIYSTHRCVSNLTQISWGTVQAGSNYSLVAYVRNNGIVEVTLSMQTVNWSPDAASKAMVLSWNYDGRPIRPGQVLAVTWTLIVFSNASSVRDFSFDIFVYGSG